MRLLTFIFLLLSYFTFVLLYAKKNRFSLSGENGWENNIEYQPLCYWVKSYTAYWMKYIVWCHDMAVNFISRCNLFFHWLRTCSAIVNTLRPRQNGRHFADDTFKHIFLNENVRIAIKMSLMFVPKGPFHNNSALVQIMAWRRPGDKPLSEPMMVRSLMLKMVTNQEIVNCKRQS